MTKKDEKISTIKKLIRLVDMAEKQREILMASFVKDIILGLVVEESFGEQMKAADREILANIPPLPTGNMWDDHYKWFMDVYDPAHKLRLAVEMYPNVFPKGKLPEEYRDRDAIFSELTS